MGIQIAILLFHFYFLNSIRAVSGSSEMLRGWACVFDVEWIWNYNEIRSGGRFIEDLGFRKHRLSVTPVFERNYLISP